MIIFTRHAANQIRKRHIDAKTVFSHLQNPRQLRDAQRLGGGVEKYWIKFSAQNGIAYIYVVTIENSQEKIIVVTAIKKMEK